SWVSVNGGSATNGGGVTRTLEGTGEVISLMIAWIQKPDECSMGLTISVQALRYDYIVRMHAWQITGNVSTSSRTLWAIVSPTLSFD
ncbi:8015_t:CDS:2, partial [Dentiscutata erythropus]